MTKNTHIAFLEMAQSGSSTMAAAILQNLASHNNNGLTFLATHSVFQTDTILPSLPAVQNLLETKQLTPMINPPLSLPHLLDTAPTVDLLIGLCLASDYNSGDSVEMDVEKGAENGLESDEEYLAKMLKQRGIEKEFAVCAYWDLRHIDCTNPDKFAKMLYEELSNRINLLVNVQI